MADYSNYRALVFAKEPSLGFVKTRMSSVLNEQQALNLHKSLTTFICTNLANWNVLPTDIYAYQKSDERHLTPLFLMDLSQRLGLGLHSQSSGDLGMKMSSALANACAEGVEGVVLLGADCPFITRHTLIELVESLRQGADAAIVPAHDGGYVALALRSAEPFVFAGVDWGSDQVFSQTVARFESLGWQYRCLSPLADIDRPEDLQLLKVLQSSEFTPFMPE